MTMDSWTMDPWDKFVEDAQVVFAALEHRFGFHRQTPSRPFIHYDSSSIRISLFYEPGSRDGGPDLGIRRKTEVETRKASYGLSSLVAVQDPVAWQSPQAPPPPTLEMLWQTLIKYGDPLLKGDCTLLDKADALEAQLAQQLGKPSQKSYTELVRRTIFRYHGRG
jgi:hypothetical protein